MLEKLYPHIQGFHSVFRWFVLLFAIVAIAIAFSGWSGRKPIGSLLFPFSLSYVLAMDVELITGLLLYFGGSPESRSLFAGHALLMFLAVLVAHIGGALTRKGPTDAIKHRGPAIAWVVSLLLIFLAIPRH